MSQALTWITHDHACVQVHFQSWAGSSLGFPRTHFARRRGPFCICGIQHSRSSGHSHQNLNPEHKQHEVARVRTKMNYSSLPARSLSSSISTMTYPVHARTNKDRCMSESPMHAAQVRPHRIRNDFSRNIASVKISILGKQHQSREEHVRACYMKSRMRALHSYGGNM